MGALAAGLSLAALLLRIEDGDRRPLRVGDFPRLWRGASGNTRRALLSAIFEEIGVKRNKVVRVSPRPRYLELVTLAMLEGLGTGGGYRGRGERSQADVIDHLRRFVVGVEEHLNDWATREKSG